jgi:hypothetical protein
MTEQVQITRGKIWLLNLVFPPFQWGVGFLLSLWDGCGTDQAVRKATAYTLSGLAGWLVYLLARRPSRWSFEVVHPALTLPMAMNVSMLWPTRTPWPFWEMLAFVVIRSAVFMAVWGLVGRMLDRRRARHIPAVKKVS